MSRLSRNVSDVGQGIGHSLSFRPVLGQAGYSPYPLIDQVEAEDEEGPTAERFEYERDTESWAPITAHGPAVAAPVRFVDGSVVSTTAGVCCVDGIYRPILIASLGAMELWLEARRLHRPKPGYRVMVAAAMVSNRIRARLLDELRGELSDLGIQLIALESEDPLHSYEVLQRRTWDYLKQEMEGLEREILLGLPEVPSLADGLLERRLTTIQSQRQPVVGMVKRNLRQYLPNSLAPVLYELQAGQRSPAFVIKTPHAELVSWYLRLTDGPMGPGAGLIRLAVPKEYLEREFVEDERFREISGISRRLCELRCRQESYGRHAVSLEPIVRLEEQLHALLPPINQFAARLRRRLGRAGGK